MKIKLKHLLEASDLEFINGYEVEEYFYPGAFDGLVELMIGEGNDTSFTIDQQQMVNLTDEGYADVLTLDGEALTMRFKVVRTLTPADFS